MAKKLNYAELFTLRPDGRYQGYYRDDTGKRRVVYDRDPQKLYLRLREIEEAKSKPATFKEVATDWHYQVMEDMADGTQASYESHYKRAVERLGEYLLEKITARDIDIHLKALKNQGLAASTTNKQLVVYRSIFGWAIVHEKYGKQIQINPAVAVKLPKGMPKPKKREAPEDDVVRKIQDNASTAYFGLFPMFLLCTGMRRGEALATRWCDIDFVAGTISISRSVSLRGARGVITDPKTESGIRTVPILPPLLPLLVPPQGAKLTDLVFHGEDPALPMPKSAYDRKWHHYCKDMGFLGRKGHTLTAHMLRHGFATMLYEAGIDEKEAAQLMGHADEEMLRLVYTHLRNKKKASAAERLKQYTANGLV